jgi:1-acyl-sn-glycerol-3-phosphate acyltransferase
MEGKIKLRRSYFDAVVSIPLYAVLYLLTALFVLFCLFFSFLHWKAAIHSAIRFWAKTGFFIMGVRLKIRGAELTQKKKNYLLLANHASLFDIMAIMAIKPDVSWFGKAYLTKIPVFGYFLKSINFIPMKTANIRNTKVMLEQLINHSQGLTIAMFPEGTRTTDGRIHDFKRGFIHVFRAAELEILPVTLKGLFELKPKTRFSIKINSRVDVIIHKPIPKNELYNKSDKEIISRVKECIESGYY